MKLTATEKQVRLTEIAQSVSDDVIRLSDKRQLETWARGLFPISKLRKAELSETLISLLASTRQQLDELARAEAVKAENEQRAKELDEQQRNIERAALLEASRSPDAIDRRIEARKLAGMQEQTVEKTAGKLWEKLYAVAVQSPTLDEIREAILLILADHTAREQAAYSLTYQKDRLGDIEKILNVKLKTVDARIADMAEVAVGYFMSLYRRANAENLKTINTVYAAKVSDRNKALIPVDARPILNFAETVLNDPASDWRDISIALALATGRRMSEIHGEGSFELVDAYRVRFIGQLKTKGTREVESYEIPTLVSSGLVMRGLAALAEKGKRFAGTEDLSTYDIVSAKVSKPLSTRMGALSSAWSAKLTFKDCRALYAEICWEKYAEQKKMSKPAYFASILGHGENDITTANSYVKFSVTLDV